VASRTSKLGKLLVERFSGEEIRTLCYDLDIDYDALPGREKRAKSRELVAFLRRRDRLGDLIAHLERSRPDLREQLEAVKQAPLRPVERGRLASSHLLWWTLGVLIILIVGISATLYFFMRPDILAPTPTAVPVAEVKDGTSTVLPSITALPSATPTFAPPSSFTPTHTPEPFDDAQFGILVADFVRGATRREPCEEGADLVQTAYEDLVRQIGQENMSSRITVRRVGPVRNDEEAIYIAEQHGARLVVWGYLPTDVQTQGSAFVPAFTLLRSDQQLIAVDPLLFGVRISGLETLELSQQLSARVTGVSTFILAMVYMSEGASGNYEQATRMLDLSIKGTTQELEQLKIDDPRRKDIAYTLSIFYATRGRAYAALGDEAQAYEDYQKALTHNPDSVRAQIGLGNYHYMTGDFDIAYEAFQEARRLDPTSYRAYYGLAILAYAQGDYYEAELQLKRAVEAAPNLEVNLAKTHFVLGLTYLKLEEREKAEVEFKRVLTNEKSPPELREAANLYLTASPTQTPIPLRITVVPATQLVYAAPVLEGVESMGCHVTLKWSWSGTLGTDEWFTVRMGTETPHAIVWTKDLNYTYQFLPGVLGEYVWEVVICRRELEECEQLAVSDRGVFWFGGCLPPPAGPSK
jgi:tetratricopeptide (TPR) repeat protein